MGHYDRVWRRSVNGVRERELPYAWVIVALAFFALAVAMGIRSTIGLLVHPWEIEFGWDRTVAEAEAIIRRPGPPAPGLTP